MTRPLAALPKAHLHLHFTGAMRHPTLVELAATRRVHLPDALASGWPPRLRGTDERGWFRFQRLYDIARSVLHEPADVFRLLAETAADERAEGSGWLEIQVDPSGYAARFGGLTPTVELVLEAARQAEAATGVGIGVIIAANRTKHPLEARTLARLAVQYAGRGVTGFGLSNDERRGAAADFAPAFRIAGRAGLLLAPHGGELAGPDSVRACLDALGAHRVGHGVAAAADADLTKRLAAGGITCEVCPASNVALGVAAGPLLFGSRLTAQYEIARYAHGLSDAELAGLAAMSVRGSAAPPATAARLLAGIDAWLAAPPGQDHGTKERGPQATGGFQGGSSPQDSTTGGPGVVPQDSTTGGPGGRPPGQHHRGVPGGSA